MSTRAVFLDRDGVINEAVVRDGRPHPPPAVDQLVILPGVGPALERLKRAGFVLLVVTNQPDVARGTVTREAVEAIHRRLRDELPLDAFYSCWHDDGDRCSCRKPLAGLLREAAREWQVDLGTSFMVGDRWRDAEAGAAAGCRTVFVDRGYAEPAPARYDARVESLPQAVDWILGTRRPA